VPSSAVNAVEVINSGLLKQVDAVTVPVPDLESGLSFYVDRLGHRMKWRNDDTGQAGLTLPNGDTELVLATGQGYEPNWLVESVEVAVETFRSGGGVVVAEPFDIPVGRAAVVRDPFGNALVLVDLSNGVYSTDEQGRVTGVSGVGESPPP
jgi:predicted enzyme related to lactoylglutathione lyase